MTFFILTLMAILSHLSPAPSPAAPSLTSPAPMHAPAEPAEDDPSFDCTIHGNAVCGPSDIGPILESDQS